MFIPFLLALLAAYVAADDNQAIFSTDKDKNGNIFAQALFRPCTWPSPLGVPSEIKQTFELSDVALDPKVLIAGDYYNITLSGTLHKAIPKDAIIETKNIFTSPLTPEIAEEFLDDYFGGLGYHFCGAIDSVDKNGNTECPPKEGDVEMKVESWLPWPVPGGNYTVQYRALSRGFDVVFCVQMTAWVNKFVDVDLDGLVKKFGHSADKSRGPLISFG
ncbi:hypothetical protein BDV96DRAFT_653072 [Lophiotrema nucula]|uniref:Phosphatidylglycerol/phosphatidylinositol transfer protein n=1 Tax=Lophiotrema nucula TaxID=690887 RepID=A0A6A5YM78_9PLEO|nr:hypothetical protein BDV96DRAFT_653072 [Lophiotrema nucula]